MKFSTLAITICAFALSACEGSILDQEVQRKMSRDIEIQKQRSGSRSSSPLGLGSGLSTALIRFCKMIPH